MNRAHGYVLVARIHGGNWGVLVQQPQSNGGVWPVAHIPDLLAEIGRAEFDATERNQQESAARIRGWANP